MRPKSLPLVLREIFLLIISIYSDLENLCDWLTVNRLIPPFENYVTLIGWSTYNFKNKSKDLPDALYIENNVVRM